MTNVLLLLLAFSYHFIQAAEREPCDPGWTRGPTGVCHRPKCDLREEWNEVQGKCVAPPREPCDEPGWTRGPTGVCHRPKCSLRDEAEGKCLAPPTPPREKESDQFESCTYIEGTQAISESANTCGGSQNSQYKCPTLVDKRCDARVKCYPKRIGGSGPGMSGVSPPPSEHGVVCAAINGQCPADPKDCIDDETVTLSGPEVLEQIGPEGLRDALRGILRDSRPRSGGVR